MAAHKLPPYAVQPPGAEFREKDHTIATGPAHQRLVAGDRVIVGAPALPGDVDGCGAAGERVGVTVAQVVPPGFGPPYHQSPEAGGPYTPARITPLYDHAPAFDALLALVASAQCRIDLIIFGWDDDVAGRTAASALIAGAGRVFIRLMVDRGGYVSGEGNALVPQGCATYLDRLKAEPNIRVIETPDPWFRFDHRKVP